MYECTTSNFCIIFIRRIRILFAFRCKPRFKYPVEMDSWITYSLHSVLTFLGRKAATYFNFIYHQWSSFNLILVFTCLTANMSTDCLTNVAGSDRVPLLTYKAAKPPANSTIAIICWQINSTNSVLNRSSTSYWVPWMRFQNSSAPVLSAYLLLVHLHLLFFAQQQHKKIPLWNEEWSLALKSCRKVLRMLKHIIRRKLTPVLESKSQSQTGF